MTFSCKEKSFWNIIETKEMHETSIFSFTPSVFFSIEDEHNDLRGNNFFLLQKL